MPYKKHIIIGLGGAGGRSIAAFKRSLHKRSALAQELIQAGAQVEYLYIDSNDDILNNRELWRVGEKHLALPANDFIFLGANEDTLEYAKASPSTAPWAMRLEEDFAALRGGDSCLRSVLGPGQLRRYGRLLYAAHSQNVATALERKLIQLDVPLDESCNYHVFASLGGGTGSGAIIDLVTQIKHIHPRSRIFLNAYVAGVRDWMMDIGFFYANQYASLRDLNALMVGKLHPHMPYINSDERWHSEETIINDVVICSDESDICNSRGFEGQIEYTAEACLSSIHACALEHAVGFVRERNGHDIAAVHQGEPLGDLQRSYRFSSIGTYRMSLGHDRMKQLFECKISQICSTAFLRGTLHYHEQERLEMDLLALIDHWKGSLVRQYVDDQKARYRELVLEVFRAARVDDLGGGDSQDNELNIINQKLREYIYSELSSKIDKCIVRELHSELEHALHVDRERYLGNLNGILSSKRRWQPHRDDVWGMRDIYEYLKRRIADYRKDSQNILPNDDYRKDVLSFRNMEQRACVWGGAGVLTRLLPKRDLFLRDHQEEALGILDELFFIYEQYLEKALYDSVAQGLESMMHISAHACSYLEEQVMLAKSKARQLVNVDHEACAIIDMDMRYFRDLEAYLDKCIKNDEPELHHFPRCWEEQLATRFEFSSRGVDDFIRDNTYNSISPTSVRELDDIIVLTSRGEIRSLLCESIYERCAKRSDEELDSMIRQLIGRATSSARLEADEDLAYHPLRPKQCLLVSLPTPSSANEEIQMNRVKERFNFCVEFHAGRGYGIEFQLSGQCDEIQLLSYNHWMPAHAITVVRDLGRIHADRLHKLETAEKEKRPLLTAMLNMSNIEGDDPVALDEELPALIPSS